MSAAATASVTAVTAYEVQGRTITMPVEVRDACACVSAFVVPSGVAAELIGDAFEIVDFLPGRTLLMLGCIDYRDNDLGDYNEVAINFFVRIAGARGGVPYVDAWRRMSTGSVPTFSWKMPVNQSFTRDAGAIIWGFPKTVERIDFDYSKERRFHGLLEMDGATVFEIDAPRGGGRSQPAMASVAYSYIDGVPHRTRFTQQVSGLGISTGWGVRLTLGGHPIADALRRLGLPKKPLVSTWAGKMVMSFEAPERL